MPENMKLLMMLEAWLFVKSFRLYLRCKADRMWLLSIVFFLAAQYRVDTSAVGFEYQICGVVTNGLPDTLWGA